MDFLLSFCFHSGQTQEMREQSLGLLYGQFPQGFQHFERLGAVSSGETPAEVGIGMVLGRLGIATGKLWGGKARYNLRLQFWYCLVISQLFIWAPLQIAR